METKRPLYQYRGNREHLVLFETSFTRRSIRIWVHNTFRERDSPTSKVGYVALAARNGREVEHVDRRVAAGTGTRVACLREQVGHVDITCP